MFESIVGKNYNLPKEYFDEKLKNVSSLDKKMFFKEVKDSGDKAIYKIKRKGSFFHWFGQTIIVTLKKNDKGYNMFVHSYSNWIFSDSSKSEVCHRNERKIRKYIDSGVEGYENSKNSTPVLITCPSCKKQVPIGENFCPECGVKIEKTYCPDCGAIVPKGTEYCPDCGKKL